MSDARYDDTLIAGIVGRFLARATADPVLGPLYVDCDLAALERRLTAFFIQYWGGPRTYSHSRGAPRLTLRHRRFPIGPRERDAWLAAMRRALDHPDLTETQRHQFFTYVTAMAEKLVNSAS